MTEAAQEGKEKVRDIPCDRRGLIHLQKTGIRGGSLDNATAYRHRSRRGRNTFSPQHSNGGLFGVKASFLLLVQHIPSKLPSTAVSTSVK